MKYFFLWAICLFISISGCKKTDNIVTPNPNNNTDPNWVKSNDSLTADVFAASGNNIYAGGRNGYGLFLSSDSCHRWQTIIPRSQFYYEDIALAVSGNHIIVGLQHIIYSSPDNGSTWHQAELYLRSQGQNISNHYINVFAIDANNIYAGTNIGVYRSTDYGYNWTKILDSLSDDGWVNIRVSSIAVNGNNIIVGATKYNNNVVSNLIYHSTDKGESWKEINLGLNENEYIYSLIINGDNIFAGTSCFTFPLIGGIYRSINNGDTWSPVKNGLPANANVSYMAAGGGNIFACTHTATDNGSQTISGKSVIYSSTNNGITWAEYGMTDYHIYAIVVSSNNIYVSAASTINNSHGIWRRHL